MFLLLRNFCSTFGDNNVLYYTGYKRWNETGRGLLLNTYSMYVASFSNTCKEYGDKMYVMKTQTTFIHS